MTTYDQMKVKYERWSHLNSVITGVLFGFSCSLAVIALTGVGTIITLRVFAVLVLLTAVAKLIIMLQLPRILK